MAGQRDSPVEQDPKSRYVRYKEVLGRGSFKTVYAAFDTVDALEVAWCKLHVDRFPAEERRKVFNEIQLLGRVQHKNIIKLYDYFMTEDAEDGVETMAFITERMMSGTLKDYLKKAKVVKLKVIRRWCNNILDAIAYLHSERIMHRDLKLDNLFINGHVGEVKIGDLGLSAVLEAEKAGSVIGTPEFMAPELYEESYTEKVDVYAFGMCLLELVSMEYPYSECKGPAQIMMKAVKNEKPAAFYKLVDSDVKDVIEHCLKREAQRPSAVDLLRHPLFRDWENDDGTRSNLSLLQGGASENVSDVAQAAEPPSGTIPGDHNMISFSECLSRDVLIASEVPGDDSSAIPEQPMRVGQGQEAPTYKVGVLIPIEGMGFNRVEFFFSPAEDNARKLAEEMASEFNLDPGRIDRIAEEIESQVQRLSESGEREYNGLPGHETSAADSRDSVAQSRSSTGAGGPEPVVVDEHLQEVVPTGAPSQASATPVFGAGQAGLPSEIHAAHGSRGSGLGLTAAPHDGQPSHGSDMLHPTQLSAPGHDENHGHHTRSLVPTGPGEPPPVTSIEQGRPTSEPLGLAQPMAHPLAGRPADPAVERPMSMDMSHEARDSLSARETGLLPPADVVDRAAAGTPGLPIPHVSSGNTLPTSTVPPGLGTVPLGAEGREHIAPEGYSTAPQAGPVVTRGEADGLVQRTVDQGIAEHIPSETSADGLSRGSLVQPMPDRATLATPRGDATLHSIPQAVGVHGLPEPQRSVSASLPTGVAQGEEESMAAHMRVRPSTDPIPLSAHDIRSPEDFAESRTAGDDVSGVGQRTVDASYGGSIPGGGAFEHDRMGTAQHASQATIEAPERAATLVEQSAPGAHAVYIDQAVHTGILDRGHESAPHASQQVMHQSAPSNVAPPLASAALEDGQALGQQYHQADAGGDAASLASTQGLSAPGPVTSHGSGGAKTHQGSDRPAIVVLGVDSSKSRRDGTSTPQGDLSRDHSRLSASSALGADAVVDPSSGVQGYVGHGAVGQEPPLGATPAPTQGQAHHISMTHPRNAESSNFAAAAQRVREGAAGSSMSTAQITSQAAGAPSAGLQHQRGQQDESAGPSAVQTVAPIRSEVPGSGSTPTSGGANDVDKHKFNIMCMELMDNSNRGRVALVKQKISQGASVTFEDFDRRTPLHLAATAGHAAVCSVLISEGADVNARDRWGHTPLEDAQKENHAEVIDILVASGAAAGEQEDSGDKAGIEMVNFSADGLLGEVKELIAAGTPVSYTDYEGRTALHVACSRGHADVADFLLLNGANPTAKDKRGRTPIDNATRNGHRNVLDVLRQNGAVIPGHSVMSEGRPSSAIQGSQANWGGSNGGSVDSGLSGHLSDSQHSMGQNGPIPPSRPRSSPPPEQLESLASAMAISHSVSLGSIVPDSDSFAGKYPGSEAAVQGRSAEGEGASSASRVTTSLPPTPAEVSGDDVSTELDEEYVRQMYEEQRKLLDAGYHTRMEVIRRRREGGASRSARSSVEAGTMNGSAIGRDPAASMDMSGFDHRVQSVAVQDAAGAGVGAGAPLSSQPSPNGSPELLYSGDPALAATASSRPAIRTIDGTDGSKPTPLGGPAAVGSVRRHPSELSGLPTRGDNGVATDTLGSSQASLDSNMHASEHGSTEDVTSIGTSSQPYGSVGAPQHSSILPPTLESGAAAVPAPTYSVEPQRGYDDRMPQNAATGTSRPVQAVVQAPGPALDGPHAAGKEAWQSSSQSQNGSVPAAPRPRSDENLDDAFSDMQVYDNGHRPGVRE